MGQVYVGHDTLLDRPVAIKFIASVDPGRVERERFLVEARAIARLQHPNVVAIYRVGEIDGRPYLVYELVRGQSLDRIPVPLDWQLMLKLGIRLSRGLAAAHRRNVLHRDIKAANAVLAADGEVKLLDFGLAKLLDGVARIDWLAMADVAPPRASSPSPDQTPVLEPADDISIARSRPSALELTAPGAPMGTPVYMAPEIWKGDRATMRSDVYSMGVLLYYLCVGRPPHEADSVAELGARVTSVDAPALEQHVSGIDPGFAAVVNRCLARDPARRPASGDELREALERLSPERRAMAMPEGNPYRGLRPFEAEHRALFFGRDADVRAVLERLRTEPWVLIAGDSGVGKSSLCRAGVLPRIVEGELDPVRTWTTITLVPGRRPIEALASVLAPCLGVSHDDLAAGLRADAGYLRGRLIRQGPGRGCAIFIDQLEELVTLANAADARALTDAIGELGARLPGVALLATVRGDFLTRLAALPGIADHIARAFHLVRPLSPDGVAEAIVGPARAAGFAFESDAMVAELLTSISIAEGGLPLLQFALAELWEARDLATRQIRRAALDRIGGVAGALARHADGVLVGLAQADRALARRILLALITSENTRARRGASELVSHVAGATAVLDALVRGRLVVARETDAGPVYEIAHEALIESWSTLRGWIDEDAGTRVARERLAAAVAEWERTGRASDALWSDRRLAELSLDRHDMAERERRFVAASRRALIRRRWLWRSAGAVIVVISAAVALALASLNRKSEQRLRVLYEEQGRQAWRSGDPLRGQVNLVAAYREGAQGAALRFMVAQGFRDLDAFEFRIRHDGRRLLSVAFDRRGTRLVTASEDRTAVIWDGSGMRLHTLSGHRDLVVIARFTPDGSQVATASYDGTARLWDTATGRERCTMDHPGPLNMVELSPAGTQLATAASDGVARLWDAATCRQLHELAPPEHVPRRDREPQALVAYDPSGARIAVWNDHGPSTIWDTTSGELVRTLDGHRGFTNALAFAPDGGRLVVGFADGNAAIFDVESGRQVIELTGHRGPVIGTRFRSDGKQVLTAGDDGAAKLWDPATGSVRLSLEHRAQVRDAQWSPDGHRIVTADSEGGVRIWNATDGRFETMLAGHVDKAMMISFDGRDRIATASLDGTAMIWDARWTRHLRAFDIPLDRDRAQLFRGDTLGAFSPDGSLVMTVGGSHPEIRLWESVTGKLIATLAGHPGGTEAGEFSSDGRKLVTCGRDRTLKIWNTMTLALERTLVGHAELVARARFSPDGEKLVSASYDHTAVVWDVARGTPIATLAHATEVLDARFSPDGTRVITASKDKLAQIWDLGGRGESIRLQGHADKIAAAMFSPDGARALTASNDRTVRIWDARSGERLSTLEGHTAEVLDAAFAPDGALIATVGLDATLRVWDATGRDLAVIPQASPLESVTWSRDGRRVLTTATDGSSRLWNVEREYASANELEARLRCRVPYRLDHERVVRADTSCPKKNAEMDR